MIVRYRGGPNNKQMANLYGSGDQIIVRESGLTDLMRKGKGTIHKDPARPAISYREGIYSKVVTPLKDGSYYYVWMGWKE